MAAPGDVLKVNCENNGHRHNSSLDDRRAARSPPGVVDPRVTHRRVTARNYSNRPFETFLSLFLSLDEGPRWMPAHIFRVSQ